MIMASDQGPVVQSALLRGELVRLRKEKQLTQEKVASDLAWSPSKLIRLEGGHSSITKVDLNALLDEYGLTSEIQRERLQALVPGARERGWWDVYREDISPNYLNYVGYEAGAAFIRQYPGTVVPGLLQTREYAEVLTASAVADEKKAISVVQLRLQRQSEMAKRLPRPRQYYVLDEAVIHRHVGINKDPAIMPRQLMHIVDRTRTDERISVRVIPFKAGEHAGLSGPFTLLEFDGDLPDILYLDAGKGTINMINSAEPQVAEYAENFETLLNAALSRDESLEFIRSAAADMS